jgi:hypothetical protein
MSLLVGFVAQQPSQTHRSLLLVLASPLLLLLLPHQAAATLALLQPLLHQCYPLPRTLLPLPLLLLLRQDQALPSQPNRQQLLLLLLQCCCCCRPIHLPQLRYQPPLLHSL